MKFYLTYKGPLLPSGKRGKLSPHKHSIRKVFHRQLKQLWKIDETLQFYTSFGRDDGSGKTYFEPEILGKYEFVSLVRKELKLSCSLDILFLRCDSPSKSVGDIDNRIKTLIDCLRCPSKQELKGEDSTPKDGECPFYCLLEDDDQIGSFAVKVDTLLDFHSADSEVKNDENHMVELVIMVELHPSVVNMLNLNFS